MIQRECFRDRAPRLAKLLGNVLVCIEEFFTKLQQTVGLFERAQVPTLQILYQADLQHSPVVHVDLNAGDLGQPCLLRGAVAALAGNDLKLLARRPYQNRLEHPFLLD